MSILHKDHKTEDVEIKFKFLSDSVLKAFEKDGRKYCRLTASSNAEDLVGDVMSQKALEQMKSSAVGTVMFMNHSTNVPEDVFGTVAEATVEKKTADLVGGGSGEVYCLEYLVEVQTDNERAVKTWQMIGSGTKLGASVTVLVRDKSPNPKRNKGINGFWILDFRFWIGRNCEFRSGPSLDRQSPSIQNPKSAIPNVWACRKTRIPRAP
ncbi:MAG: hypothetical protein IPN69_14635 [Acidobacteria bacterium]|nr:hypothetical protein [Acidobacteriota bacterium]